MAGYTVVLYAVTLVHLRKNIPISSPHSRLVPSHTDMSDSLQPHGLQPTRLLCSWDSPSKNTGVHCHFPASGDLLDPGIKPTSPALAGIFFTTEPPGKP